MAKENRNRKRQYAVLGLGIFGSTVAKTLSKYNCEVIAIDKNMECVQRVADTVSVAVQGNITDMNVLKSSNIGDCDVVIVATGSHLEESILCLLNLKALGVPYIVAKAKNKSYKEILEKVGADRVVRPEKEMGVVIAKGLLNKNIIDMFDLDDEYSVIEVAAPKKWVNKTLAELDVRNNYNINVLGIRHKDNHLDVTPSPTYLLVEEDHLLIISDSTRITKLDFLEK